MKTKQPKFTVCPSASYDEYKPDTAMRAAMERAKRDQPALCSLASKVPDISVAHQRSTK